VRIPYLSLGLVLVCVGFMLVMIFKESTGALSPEIRYVPKPTPSEQTTLIPLAQCDSFGCVPLYDVKKATP
jgi:hypothetical protein